MADQNTIIEQSKLNAQAELAIAPVVPFTRGDVIAQLEALPVMTDDEEKFAVTLCKEIKGQHDELETQRKTITKPLNDAKKATDALFKPALDALKQAEQILKSKLAAYAKEKEQRNVAALEQARQAPTAQGAQQAIARVAPVVAPQGVSVRQVWKFTVTDENAVPRELCSPDPKKIAAAFQVVNGQPVPVPGVRWYQEDSVTVRK